MQVKVLVYALLQTDLIGNDELRLRDLVVGGNVLGGHELEQIVLRVELLVEIPLDELIPLVFEVVQQLHPFTLQIQP